MCLLLPVAALLLVTSCAREDPEVPTTAPQVVEKPRPRLVILISIDTLRADHLGFYGYERPTSPALDALASKSAVFEDASSTSTWTLPAHASMLSGLFPNQHGLTRENDKLAKRVHSLPSILAARGFTTLGVVNSVYLSRRRGFDRGFDELLYVEEFVERVAPSNWITDQATQWLQEAGDAPTFLFMHYYDVHSDYRSLPEFERQFARPYEGAVNGSTTQLVGVEGGEPSLDERDAAHLIDLYDAGVRQLDAELQRFFDFLRDRGLFEESLLVLTSDHGEEFLDHGGVLHGSNQFQETLRVPLLIRGPGIPAVRIRETPVSLVDIVPTVLALLDIPAPADLDGRDLSPLWRNRTGGDDGIAGFADRYLFSESDHQIAAFEHNTRAVRQGRYKLHHDLLTGIQVLYDLQRDPQEREDLAHAKPDLTQRLRAQLDRIGRARRKKGRGIELSEEEIRKLKSLGYGG
jgi:arylsulfatase A-like enzyme